MFCRVSRPLAGGMSHTGSEEPPWRLSFKCDDQCCRTSRAKFFLCRTLVESEGCPAEIHHAIFYLVQFMDGLLMPRILLKLNAVRNELIDYRTLSTAIDTQYEAAGVYDEVRIEMRQIIEVMRARLPACQIRVLEASIVPLPSREDLLLLGSVYKAACPALGYQVDALVRRINQPHFLATHIRKLEILYNSPDVDLCTLSDFTLAHAIMQLQAAGEGGLRFTAEKVAALYHLDVKLSPALRSILLDCLEKCMPRHDGEERHQRAEVDDMAVIV